MQIIDQFIYSTQFNIKKPETYTRTMQGLHTTEWVRAMKKELDQLYKYEI